MQDDDDDDDDNDDPMILNNRAKNHTSERTIVPWMVIFHIGPGPYFRLFHFLSRKVSWHHTSDSSPSYCSLVLDVAYFHWAHPIHLIRVGVSRGGRNHLTANMWIE